MCIALNTEDCESELHVGSSNTEDCESELHVGVLNLVCLIRCQYWLVPGSGRSIDPFNLTYV